MAETDSASAARRFVIARSTLVHEVFCVRYAPTITSNWDSAGHQCCGPHKRRSVRNMARMVASAERITAGYRNRIRGEGTGNREQGTGNRGPNPGNSEF